MVTRRDCRRSGHGRGLNDFVENPKFRATMHEAIQTGLRENRNLPALGRIGNPDDIIASVLVRDSKVSFGDILPDTYQPMPSYRLCTSDGPTLLTEGLAVKLKLVLEGAIAREAAQ
ncbi:uncharacterized protein BJ212DRAFT_1446306 [Suillus subaureus]|uniref:Uncharacterized protein n=1 Tax=Suillus subaureus TaxID=48587 RepID=A0A9P7JFJ2_9AGAM|nr:uncharacterized protein BJ212DRAFT_1446306 [Suillus subaureus]KAG1819259.1 hypothetical protein BJ212DRAFT_1446306 [Suillus subaureus]